MAEGIGTAFLLAGVVGSGIMAQRLSEGNAAVALLANTLATGAVLLCLIAALAPISGAHFNPAVSLADAMYGGLPWREVPAYWLAQNFRRFTGRRHREYDVRPPRVFYLAPRAWRRWSTAGRVRCHVRSADGDLGLRTVALAADRLCRGGVYRRGVLVYLVHVVRQSGGNDRAIALRYVCRHPAAGRRALYRRSVFGRISATLLFRWLAPLERKT